MPKKQKPFFVRIVILSTVTAIVWVGSTIYKTVSKKEEPNIPVQILEPLTPTLDKKVLDELENRVFLEESTIPETRVEVGVQAATPKPVETIAPEETPVATESGEEAGEEI